jgi:signal transduction histidine kinase
MITEFWVLLVGILILIIVELTMQILKVKSQSKQAVVPVTVAHPAPARQDTRLQQLLDRLPDYVLQFDSRLRLLFSNKMAHELIQNAELELLEESAGGLTLSRSLTQTWFRELLAVLRTGKEHVFEFQMNVSGLPRKYEVHAIPDIDSQTGEISVICVIRDTTLRGQMEAQRVKLQVEKQRVQDISKLSEDLAHDLRTPLSAIGTSAYILHNAQDADKREQHLININTNIKQIAKLLDNMLLMTHLDGYMPLASETVNMNALVGQISERFEMIAQQNLRTFSRESGKLSSIQGDVRHLQIALENVLYNAIRFTGDNGKINVSAYQQDQTIYIKVQDNGIGMTPEQVEHCFDRFYRADASRTRDPMTGGSGLGLSIARGIIQRHSGKIELQSQPGIGTQVTISLPTNITCINDRYSLIHSDSKISFVG